jgi:hypothetical protein
MQDGLNALMAIHAAQLSAQAARDEASAAAAPRPAPHKGFSKGCDSVGCASGLAWSLAAGTPPPPVSSCARCGEARYCSVACQRADWLAGHKKYCGRLRAAPRPLRLVQRVVRAEAVAGRGLLPTSYDAHCEDDLERVADVSMRISGKQLNASALDELLGRLPAAPTRIILIVPHNWAHAVSGSGETRAADLTIFEVGAEGDASIDGALLLAALDGAMPYIFREEDRLAEGVRYEPSTGSPKVGFPCPPRMAFTQGASVNPHTSIVTNAGPMANIFGFRTVVVGPPRWRWATMGPFECSEMALEDISIQSVEVSRNPTWPDGWYTILAIHQA